MGTTAREGEESGASLPRGRAAAALAPWARRPAVLLDRHLTVLAATGPARALSPAFRTGTNLARYTFLDTLDQQESPSWQVAADQITAMLRDSLDRHEGDRGFLAVVGELSATSSAFAHSWAGGARAATSGSVDLPATAAGPLRLRYRLSRIPPAADDDDERTLLLFEPADATSREALERLAADATPRPASDRPRRPPPDEAEDGAR
ncbi:hypothetical protein HQQ82_14085 [Rathayibacter sp. VKM Ac-2856]|uniref:MmyB family transcriptional regulator n=1 Tax=unclassified Rathayibacter TaxID=2609250 RepID=UPI0015667DAE|nr:hypothetical protein [Rathayibacter sp. VKM Ac-2858]NQX21108.1 hypothetical protein [Rathayibacter sp. VKM Ac-2856]